MIETRAVTTGDRAALARFFESSSCDCHCRYWFFEGTKNDWLARCAFSKEENEAELANEIALENAVAVIAIEEDEIVGWLRATPRARLPRLRALPVYRARDLGPDADVVSVACMLVRPTHRHRGIARALLREAKHVHNARILESYPRRAIGSERLRDDEAWLGPEHLFLTEGFAEHHAPTQKGALFETNNETYPILRLPNR